MKADIGRLEAVNECMDLAKKIVGEQGVTQEALAQIGHSLKELASCRDFWMTPEFAPPMLPELTSFYLISRDQESGYCLYLNIMRPGEATPIHNHTTWACIATVEGVETNRLYRRLDDGQKDEFAQLVDEGIRYVGESSGIEFLPDGIHQVSNTSDRIVSHLHLYGQDIEELTHRLMFNLANNTYQYMPLVKVDDWKKLGSEQ